MQHDQTIAEAECPVRTTVRLLGGKYKSVIVWGLMGGTKRFSEIQALVPEATSKMITKQLRELEADGLVHRNVVSDNPPWVEYSLTTTGQTLIPLLEAMSEWGALYQDMRREKARLSGSSRSPG